MIEKCPKEERRKQYFVWRRATFRCHALLTFDIIEEPDNLGTYTKQWQVADLGLFEPGLSPLEGFFYVLEEIPGKIVFKDMTWFINENGHWPSYNVPYFKDIYEESGNAAACKAGEHSGNTDLCYDTCPRANIFRARQGSVKTMADFQYMINYNDWKNDPFSMNDPCKAIACRRDLETDSSTYPAGGMDGKASSALMLRAARGDRSMPSMLARMGPTSDDQPPFCWSNQEGVYMHNQQPDCFTYKWAAFPPAN